MVQNSTLVEGSFLIIIWVSAEGGPYGRIKIF